MIYYTGDIHGQKYDIERFCKRFNPTREDIIVILAMSVLTTGKTKEMQR